MMIRLALLFLFLSAGSASAADVRCARVDDTNTILEYRIVANQCPQVAKGNWRWLPAPATAQPAYDSALQVLSGPVITVGPTEVTTSYSVRDKTAQELAADADAAQEARLNSVDIFVLKTLCDHESRIRVLEGKSAVTFAQCRAAIKAALQ